MLPIKRTISIALTLACFAILVLPSASGQALQLKFNLSKRGLLLGEPVFLNVTLTNTGQADIDIVPFADAFQVFLGRVGTDLQRYHFKPELSINAHHHRRPLRPADSFTIRLPVLVSPSALVAPPLRTNVSIFAIAEPGEYEVQVKYGVLVAASIRFNVEEPPASEAEPWSYLKTNWVVAVAVQVGEYRLGSNMVHEIKQILDRNQDTAYRSYLSEALPPPAPSPPPVVITKLQEATAQLAALRYDIRGFQRDNPTAAKEHLVKVMQLNDQRGFGAITTEEFDRRCAELLREYMTNFATPLSPEEWARRTEQYAREDAIRAAEEQKRNDLIRQKQIEELERRPKP